ncbi:MAG: gamma-glutamylcyclotransferase [Proteobacteria bacterium]|nr:gamma-glutamylcyclotransferase [Pseudomonadota bacterium]
MWNPGFPHLEVRPARLHGYHRAFCLYSHHYRGTEARPGLVLGLDRGGSCRGRAYRVAARDAEDVIAYLDAREQVTAVYLRRRVTIEIGAARVAAVTYVADRAHDQYAGKLPLRRAAEIILGGHGVAGDNPEYLEHTVAHLDELGINDGPLHELLGLVREARA